VPTIKTAAGRDAAFERLYRRYVHDVYRYSLALLRNPADAEDVTQTTFMKAYRVFRRGERIEKPQNWLIKIAHNTARSRYARAQRRVQEVPLDERTLELPVGDEDKPEVQEVLAALAELPFNQRAALVMRELEGRSYAEIAQTLNVTQSAVEALIFRARRSLRVGRSSVRGLTLVQLPSSLASFLDGPGGIVAGGGALVGGGLLLKAAAVVAVSAAVAGAGYKTEAATTTAPPPARERIHPVAVRLAAEKRPVRGARVARRSAVTAARAAPQTRSARPAADAAAAPAAKSAGTAEAVPSAGTHSVVDTVASTVASAPLQLPVQQPVQPPATPVQVPTATLPAPTATLPAPTLPQLPTPLPTVPVPTVPTLP
jgi:RNA polymerase sigma factor (sigma-70 family)